MYTERTRDDILDEMLEGVRDDVDKREGGVVFDMLAEPAQQFELVGFVLEAILENGFMDTAQAQFVDMRAAEFNIFRKEAVHARGVLLVKGRIGTTIKASTAFSVAVDGSTMILYSEKFEVIEIDGEVLIEVVAEVAGVEGNIGTPTDITCNEHPNLEIIASTAITGGINREADDELKERYRLKGSRPITSGNRYHYELWSREVEGIGGARVVPLANGSGTVRVIVMDMDGKAPTPEKIEQVKQHIEVMKPIGATVEVVAILEIKVNVSVTVSLLEGLTVEDVQLEIEKNIAGYLETVDNKIRHSRIGSAILDSENVRDYENLKISINDEVLADSNISVSSDDVTILGVVTLA